MILTTIFEKYPYYYSYFDDFWAFFKKSLIIASLYLWIYSFLCSMIFTFLTTHCDSGISVTNIYKPSTTTSILLDAKLFHGIFNFKQPNLLYFIFNGKLSFLIAYFFRLTFFMRTSPDHKPIFKFYELKPYTYSPKTLFSILSTSF